MFVVYFDQLLGAAFSVISWLKSTKNVWKWIKNIFFSFFAYSSKLVNMQKLVDSLRGYLKIVFFGWFLTIFTVFQLFFNWFQSFFVNLYVSTSFWVRAAPKSWSKYTTHIHGWIKVDSFCFLQLQIMHQFNNISLKTSNFKIYSKKE